MQDLARPESEGEKAEGTAKRRFSWPGAGIVKGAAMYEPVTWVTDLTGHIGNTF
jgi:hypothetical protein